MIDELLTKHKVKIAGYWLSSIFAFYLFIIIIIIYLFIYLFHVYEGP